MPYPCPFGSRAHWNCRLGVGRWRNIRRDNQRLPLIIILHMLQETKNIKELLWEWIEMHLVMGVLWIDGEKSTFGAQCLSGSSLYIQELHIQVYERNLCCVCREFVQKHLKSLLGDKRSFQSLKIYPRIYQKGHKSKLGLFYRANCDSL